MLCKGHDGVRVWRVNATIVWDDLQVFRFHTNAVYLQHGCINHWVKGGVSCRTYVLRLWPCYRDATATVVIPLIAKTTRQRYINSLRGKTTVWRYVSMKVVARIFLDVTGHMTSQLVLLRWPSSTQYSARCATDGVRKCSATVCWHCDERAWTFAVCIYYSTSVVSHVSSEN